MITRLFGFKGGVKPESHKNESSGTPIQKAPMPKRLVIPLRQSIRSTARCLVQPGQKVLKGEHIGEGEGGLGTSVHASTSGTVVEIAPYPMAHASGLETLSVVIEPDGEDRWIDHTPLDLRTVSREEALAWLRGCGIVGMGGAGFPTHVKVGGGRGIEMLVINGAECEPWITCDDRLMRERAAEVIDGVRLILHGIRWGRAIIAIEDNKSEALAAMGEAAKGYGQLEVVAVPTLYPMGSEKQLIKTVTGLEVPAGGLAAQVGVLVQNVATAYAVHEAIRYGRPLVRRIVTVSGGAVRDRRNLEVPIGTLVDDLLRHCGYAGEPERLLMGGPMMGTVLPHAMVPIVKGSNGVLALSKPELPEGSASPCIRCGSCVRVCPVGLMPLELMKRAQNNDLDGAVDYGLSDCLSCGTCAYVCPAHLPLTHYFNYAKGELAARAQQKRKTDYTKQLVQARQARLEREAQAKAEAAAKRKAERAAKKAQEAEA